MGLRCLLALSVLGTVLTNGDNKGILMANAGRQLLNLSDAVAKADINHWAGYEMVPGEYYGTSARINAWDLKLKPGQTSSSGMWLLADGGNQIMAGFHISPARYNDTNLHFFVGC